MINKRLESKTARIETEVLLEIFFFFWWPRRTWIISWLYLPFQWSAHLCQLASKAVQWSKGSNRRDSSVCGENQGRLSLFSRWLPPVRSALSEGSQACRFHVWYSFERSRGLCTSHVKSSHIYSLVVKRIRMDSESEVGLEKLEKVIGYALGVNY